METQKPDFSQVWYVAIQLCQLAHINFPALVSHGDFPLRRGILNRPEMGVVKKAARVSHTTVIVYGIDGPNRCRWFTELKNGGTFQGYAK